MNATQSANLLCARIEQCCVNLLAPAGLGMLATQVRRVLFQITSEDERPTLLAPLDVARFFKRRGLIPPVLFEKLEELEAKLRTEAARRSALPPPSLAPMAFAVAFAACLFPQRSVRKSELLEDDAEVEFPQPATSSGRVRPECVLDEELSGRVGCFWSVLVELKNLTGARASLWQQVVHALNSVERLPEGLRPGDLEDLLSDLCAAEQSPSNQLAEPDDRRAGAALYLATCDPGVVDWIVQTWRLDAEFVRFLRRAGLSCPPSQITGANAENEGHPEWEYVTFKLSKLFPRDAARDKERPKDAKVIETAIILEQTVRKRGRLHYVDVHEPSVASVPADVMAEIVRSFWQKLFLDKVDSGFPYFAFRSRFTRYWSQCVIFHSWPQLEWAKDEEEQVIIIDPSDPEPDGTFLNEVHFIREGYRLLRLMFFRGSSSTKDEEEGDGSPDGSDHVTPTAEASIAFANDMLREALDLTFYYHVLRKDDDIPRPSFKEIGEPRGFTEDEVNNWARRLRERLGVYVAARVEHKSNKAIRAEFPKIAKGWIPFANLCRIVPAGQRLLWLLTARVFLYDFLPERHRDPFPFERYLRELWHWAHDVHLSQAIEGFIPGSVAVSPRIRAVEDTIFLAIHRPPLRRLWDDLKRIETPDELKSYLAGQELNNEYAAAQGLVREVIGESAFARCNRTSFATWCKIAGRRKYWVIPVWYLTFIEQLATPALLERLKADFDDKAELDVVSKLIDAMQREQIHESIRS